MKQIAGSCQSPFRLRMIRKQAYTVAHVKVVCALYALEGDDEHVGEVLASGYAVGMKTCDSRYLYFLGHDAARATDVFERVTKYKVSPCTLKDVLDDLTSSGINL